MDGNNCKLGKLTIENKNKSVIRKVILDNDNRYEKSIYMTFDSTNK